MVNIQSKINKRNLLISILLIVVAAVAAVGGVTFYLQTRPPDYGGTIKVGVLLPFSGVGAEEGKYAYKGGETYAAEVNAKGGILVGGKLYNITLVHMDDAGAVQTGVAAMERLCVYEGVDVIVGGQSSSVVLAAMDTPQREGIPFIAACAMSESIYQKIANQSFNYVFQLSPTTREQAETEAALSIYYLKPKTVAMLVYDADAGRSAAKTFKEYYAKNSPNTTIAYESYVSRTDIPNWLAELTKVKSLNPDFIYVFHGSLAAGLAFADTYEELGMTTKVVATGTFTTPDFRNQSGLKSDHWLIDVMYAAEAPITSLSTPFNEAYKAKYGTYPTKNAAQMYDGMIMMTEAIKKAGSLNKTAIAEALAEITVTGVRGENMHFTSMAEGHRLPLQLVAVQMQNGTAVVVWPLSAKQGDYIP